MGNTKKWELGTSEIGKAVGNYIYSSKTFKVYIPRILPLVKFGKAKIKTVSLNKNCFINSAKCKPSVASQIKTVNYITIKAAPLSKFPSKIIHGEKLKINVANHNIDRLTVASKSDPIV